MALALAHRGPDDEQVLSAGAAGQVGLAFTRLALVDPDGGRQPFVSPDGSVALVCNGEIYNHRELAASLPPGTLRSRSDCEVLLPLYLRHDLDFLDHVRGMFGIAIYDRRRGRLILARDRLGIKPLFYAVRDGLMMFGSEIKALFQHPACPRRLDWQRALAEPAMSAAPVLTDDPPLTWFEGIEHVPAATILQIDLATGRMDQRRYWTLPEPEAEGSRPEEEYVRRYRELLTESVRECLTADAEVGLMLSGGIDSAAVAGLAADAGVHTFTVLTASTVANDDARLSATVARTFGLPHHSVLLPADRVPDAGEWKHLLWLTETPQCGPEQFYKHELHRYAKAKRPALKAMMLGSGADELNGGYTVELSLGGDWDDFLATVREMARRRVLGSRPGLAAWWDHFDLPMVRGEAFDHYLDQVRQDPYAAFLAWKCRDMQQYNFWHEDRTSAGNAIEARVPFLDHRIVELLAAIPRSLRRTLLWDKQISRRAMADILPDEVLRRPKVGFYEGDGVHHTQATFVRMLAANTFALVEEAFEAPGAKEHLDRDNVLAVLRMLAANPRRGRVELPLRLVNMGLLESMAADPPAPESTWHRRAIDLTAPRIDWETERPRIEQLTLGRPVDLPSHRVPRLGDGVMLVNATDDERISYVVVNGSLEYVLDATEEPDWVRFLRAVDGERDLGQIAADIGCDLTTLHPLLREAMAIGVLALSDAAAESPG
jgi:asparagine synthase (glutamine-hydrolysing)